MYKLLILLLFVFSGCTSTAPLKLSSDPRLSSRSLHQSFEASPSNRYALIIKGESFKPDGSQALIQNAEDLSRGKPIIDPYIDNDVDQMARLALSKGYQVVSASMGSDTVEQLYNRLVELASVSNETTQVLIAYSGEGDKTGWITRRCLVGERSLTTEDCRVKPEKLIQALIGVQGVQALLINACESGCFVEAARKNPDFKGVVVASCSVGFATTPHEPSNLSATYAAFLHQYQDDPSSVKNISTLDLTKAGFWWNNFRHQISDIGAGGLPISYDLVKYSTANFLF